MRLAPTLAFFIMHSPKPRISTFPFHHSILQRFKPPFAGLKSKYQSPQFTALKQMSSGGHRAEADITTTMHPFLIIERAIWSAVLRK
ncbi:hypothetical protein KC332_g25 [Hortaea werneckii]|nr:hypothetical protein KC348_g31 [Hortaea werneckii]KAI7421907.1 hypothetical protein KC332_g25 [Hortaea werneckii]KAI7456593.1 hypothetical protein KC368_g59 [Hortaea werneckii]